MGKKNEQNASKNVLQVSGSQMKQKGKNKKLKMKRQWKKITFKNKSKVLKRDQQVAKTGNAEKDSKVAKKTEPYKGILKKTSGQKSEATSSATTVQTLHNSRV